MNVKSDTTIVTERGQTSIPAHLRAEMRLEKGKRLLWKKVSDDEFRVRILPSANVDPLGVLGFAKRFRKTRRTSDWMADLRAGEK